MEECVFDMMCSNKGTTYCGFIRHEILAEITPVSTEKEPIT